MKTLASIAILIALVALAALSLAPAEWVGERGGYTSFAGIATAIALAVVALAGGWIWLRDRRTKR